MSGDPFSTLISMDGAGPRVHSLETFPRHTIFEYAREASTIDNFSWVKSNWRVACQLYISSDEFRLAADALDNAQFIQNEALALVSLWAAMESLFSPSTSELKFRVSALIASYIEATGDMRISMQKKVASLYDKRSAAAHEKPKHQKEDLVETFELLRRILIKIIQQKSVPSKSDLELLLFGQ